MNTVPLRRLIESVSNGSWGVDAGGSDVDVFCIRAADFEFERMRASLRRAPTRSIDSRTWDRLALRPGDIVLEKSGGGDYAPVGRAVLFDSVERAVTSNFAARVRVAQEKVDPRFLTYALRSLYDRGETTNCIKQTTGIQNLDTEHWLSLPMVALAIEDQRRIADFLDDRVDRIDRIIAARRQQIELSESSFDSWWANRTQRLADDVGLIPIRRVLESIADGPFGSSLTSRHYSDAGTRVIRLGNIGIAAFKDGDAAFIPKEYGDTLDVHEALAGDLIMAGLGDERWPLGRCAVVPDGIGPAIVKADCYRIRLAKSVGHTFAAVALSSPPARQLARLLSRGATRARLNTEVAREAMIPAASTSQQDAYVADWVGQKSRQVRLADAFQRHIDLLTEYKSSLITAAVTRDLDVTTAGSGVPG